jgi:hypothetical protein
MSQMGDDVSSAITNYIETQTEDFKLALIFHVFGHGLYAQTSARSSRLHSHPIIEELIERELNYAPGSRGNILISDVILRSGYTNAFWGNEETRMSKEKLFKYLEAILDSENPSLGKAVCNIIFASNIVSAVHKHHDWLIIVRRLVTHSNPEVQEYAIALFNRHFHHVWEDLLLSRDNEVIKNWFSEEALQEFFEESEPFMMAVNLLKLSHGWERYTEHQKQVTLEIIHELALLPDFHSKWLAFRFINRMDDRLIDSEQEKLYRAIFGDEEHRWETNIPGREEQLERDFALDEYLPKFDWSKYI